MLPSLRTFLGAVHAVDEALSTVSFPTQISNLSQSTTCWVRRLFWRVVLSKRLVRWYDRNRASEELGAGGERAAERLLLRQGMIVLYRGYRDRLGEIDLIAVDRRTVVFVEVKTRASNVAGEPEDAVDAAKQAKLTKTAIGFLKWHRLTDCASRFDVVAITWPADGAAKIAHYRDAFPAVGKFQFFS